MRKVVIAIALASAGCSVGVQNEAQEAVARDLRDPSSAQFRDVKIYPKYVCGEINGKNGMGAYAGFTRFWYNREKKIYSIDPKSADGDDLDRTEQRISNGSYGAFCRDDA